MKGLQKRLSSLEGGGERMVVAKLPKDGDLDALLSSEGIELRSTDLLVRINRPEGCGSDFARVAGGDR
jgi:hypothetical protein